MKVILLGLDGMTLEVLKPYVEADLLPNFKKVIEKGSYGILRSTIPSVTGPGWTSMTTGKNPGKHGIYEFRKRIGYKTELITKNTSQYAEALWSILSRNDKKVVVGNVPVTYPPDEVNGIMISGLMTPSIETDFVYPKQIKKELFKLVPDYQLDIKQEFLFTDSVRKKLSKEAIKITGQKRKLMNYLLDKKSWDFFFFAFVGPDRIQHFMWDEILSMEPECVKFYKLLDDILGDILNKLDDDTVLLIASDHGFSKINKFFAINTFFNEAGLLHVKANKKLKVHEKTGALQRLEGNVLNAVKSLNLKKYLPAPLVDYLKKFLPKPELTEDQINWDNTKAFSLLEYGIVSLNLQGREPKGVVTEGEYDRICELVEKELLSVKDPQTDKNIVKAVLRCDKLYSPEHSDNRPDLVVVMEDGYLIYIGLGRSVISENVFRRSRIAADHHRNGLYIAYGNIFNNKKIDAEIYDIMPTILYLMGVGIPEDVDGEPLSEIIKQDFVENNKIKFEKPRKLTPTEKSALNEQEAKEVEKHLKNLGYLG